VSRDPPAGAYRYALIVVLGISMGIQNAAARKLAVPDLTTTVLTLTITRIPPTAPWREDRDRRLDAASSR